MDHASDGPPPGEVVLSGPDLFVLNGDGCADNDTGPGFGSVTELDASTGALVKVMSGSISQFDCPDAMVLDGPDLFVANSNSSVTELTVSTGALVRSITGSAYQFNSPDAMALSGPDLFAASGGESPTDNCGGGYVGGWVTELNASTGALVKVRSSLSFQFDDPDAMALSGPNLFVANSSDDGCPGGSITELNATTGALVRVMSGSAYQFDGPDAMVLSGPNLFVANSDNGSVTELPI